MADRIEGRVAQILTARELVINRGTVEGVEVGMRFAVLNRRGTDIRDPDTGDVLGSIELEKVLVKVVRVDEHLAVARTFRTFRVPGTGALGWTSFQGSPARTVPETLKTDERRLKDELDEKESYVKIGDPLSKLSPTNSLTTATYIRQSPGSRSLGDPLLRRSSAGLRRSPSSAGQQESRPVVE